MNYKKLILFIILILFTFLVYLKVKSINIPNKSCKYEKFNDEVRVKELKIINDSVDLVCLKSLKNSKMIYQMDSWQFYVVLQKNFKIEVLKDSLNNYQIFGSRITEGCCTPYNIDKMVLVKK